MQVITDIGHAAINAGGRQYLLRPSFLAMTRIGSPEEIITALATVHGSRYPQHRITNPEIMRQALARAYAETLHAAAGIVQACCEDDLSDILGKYRINARGKLHCIPGAMPPESIITLAQHLSLHGVLGTQPQPAGKDKGEYSARFDARSWAYAAMAHLGLGEMEAWQMTMTGLRAALAAKYPVPEKKKIPTEEEYDEFMEIADALVLADAGGKR